MQAWPHESESEDEQEQFKPLTPQEAQAWRQQYQPLSLGYVLIGQALVGVLVTALAAALFGVGAAWSAAYGALVVVVPSAVFARALARKAKVSGAAAAVTRMFMWELVKLLLSVALLVLAPRLLSQLNWLALLAGMVLVSKTYWLAWWYQRAKQQRTTV